MAQAPKHMYILTGAWRRFAPPEIVVYDDDFGDDALDDADLDFDAPENNEFEASDADLDAPSLWTRHRRILLTVIVILMLIAFLAYSFQGFFLPPPPPPTLAPGSLI